MKERQALLTAKRAHEDAVVWINKCVDAGVLSPPEAEAQRYSVYSLYSYRSSVSTRACSRLPKPRRSGTQFTRLAAVSVYSLSSGISLLAQQRYSVYSLYSGVLSSPEAEAQRYSLYPLFLVQKCKY